MRLKSAAPCLLSMCLLVSTWAVAEANMGEAERLFTAGGIENLQKSIPLYCGEADRDTGSFEANWKCARSRREYADQAKKKNLPDWKKICAEQGKAGMQYAQKAIDLQPGKPDGFYYYGVNVGIYSDGVSIVTALSEGLKDKTQGSFEKAYALDRNYKQGGPMLSLGRFWSVLPWPLHDRAKGLAYFREYQKAGFFEDNLEAHLFLSELLIKLGGEANQSEAKKYLEKAAESKDSYFREWAKRLLSEIGK